MKRISIKLFAITTLIFIASNSFDTPNIEHSLNNFEPNVDMTDTEFENRLLSLENEIPLTFNKIVKGYILDRVDRNQSYSAKLIGASQQYFPMMEHILSTHNLPEELKYISVIESGMNPKAKSPVGASGLWQFMPSTGKMMGLKINAYVDERNDPYLATIAAAEHFADLYERYDDWLLALAAYNCGPGRVNQAIRNAGSDNFWKIYTFLPRETRSYVPKFIATAYLMNYYYLHDIEPVALDYDIQYTESIRVYDVRSFNEIARETGVAIDLLKELNPSFKQNVVPSSKDGYLVFLPIDYIGSYQNIWYDTFESVFSYFPEVPLITGEQLVYTNASPDSGEITEKRLYKSKAGDSLEDIAGYFDVSTTEISEWNGFSDSETYQEGQEIVLFVSRNPSVTAQSNHEGIAVLTSNVRTPEVYVVQKGDNLSKIAAKYSGVSVKDLLKENALSTQSILKIGMEIRIP